MLFDNIFFIGLCVLTYSYRSPSFNLLFLRFGQYLKQRSASISEYRPLNGFDMSMLGEVCIIILLA